MEQPDLITTINGIEIHFEQGQAGLWYVTSPNNRYKGLLVTGKTREEARDRVPQAIRDLDEARDKGFYL